MAPVVSASNTVVDVVTGLVTTISVVQSVKHLDHTAPLLGLNTSRTREVDASF